MGRLERALTTIQDMEGAATDGSLSPLCLFLLTTAYLVAMLSVAPGALAMILWFGLFPIVAAPLVGLPFPRLFLRSLIVLPLAAVIGMFNPILDPAPAFVVGDVTVSRGWVTFISIIVRALLSMQALLLLIHAVGFAELCRSMRRLGMPEFLTVQLLMVYRYLVVLLQEALDMRRAREARGFGKRSMPLRMWGAFAGQLFLRTMARADNIHRAMLARGFDGSMPTPLSASCVRWRTRDTLVLAGGCALFLLFRLADISSLLGFKQALS